MMSESQKLLWMIKGAAQELPKEQAEELDQVCNRLRTIVSEHGDIGTLAVCIVGAEAVIQYEEQ